MKWEVSPYHYVLLLTLSKTAKNVRMGPARHFISHSWHISLNWGGGGGVSWTEVETTEKDMSVKKNKIKISMLSFNKSKATSKNVFFLLENVSLDKKKQNKNHNLKENTISQLTLGLFIVFHI